MSDETPEERRARAWKLATHGFPIRCNQRGAAFLYKGSWGTARFIADGTIKMSDTEQTLPPWTPGPWEVDHGNIIGRYELVTENIGDKAADANLDLITLAPEIAEAILAWHRHFVVERRFEREDLLPIELRLWDIADKVRGIGK